MMFLFIPIRNIEIDISGKILDKNWRRKSGTNQYSEFQQNPYPFAVSFPDTYDAMFKEAVRVNVANNLEASVSGGTVTVNGTSSASFNDYLFKEQHQISFNVLNGILGTDWSFQGWSSYSTNAGASWQPERFIEAGTRLHRC